MSTPPKKKLKKETIVITDEMLKDIAEDYCELLENWLNEKKCLIRDYKNAVMGREQMVCPNCKMYVNIVDDILVNKDGSQNSDNPHVICSVDENEDTRETSNYSCNYATYEECFLNILKKTEDK